MTDRQSGASPKVMVAMSGGVDSSVAAAVLKDQGYQVTGVTLQIWPSDTIPEEVSANTTCCSLGAVEDARRVAAKIGIPHYVLNFQEVFRQKVIEDFCREYQRGRTPNPCIRCNQKVKFEVLLSKAKALEMGYLATGHYARIEKAPSGQWKLLRGRDRNKDQSYMLYTMDQEQLSHTLFPLGGQTKEETRKLAAELGFSVADKPESQEICFIPDNDYGRFLEEKGGASPGEGKILDVSGEVIGTHSGIHRFTVGQRRGIGISAPDPLYVVEVRATENTIVVGSDDHLYARDFLVEELTWTGTAPPEEKSIPVEAKIRYRMEAAPAIVDIIDQGKARVEFKDPQRAVTPGQSAVFYQGEEVLGGGIITLES